MSDDNVVPMIRKQPKDMSDPEVNNLWDFACALMRAEAQRLCPETILGNKPLPDQSLSQVGMESYIDCNGKRCFRPMGEGERQRALNRIRDNYEYRAHVEAVYRENTERRLTEIDPDWLEHYKSFEAAERAYWRELQSPTTPSAERELDEAIDDGITFDDGMTDEDRAR